MRNLLLIAGIFFACVSVASLSQEMQREDEIREIVMSMPDELYEEIYLSFSGVCDHVTDRMIAEYYIENYK